MIVKPEDVRRAGLCLSQTLRWLDRHGLDRRKFITEGIDEAELAGIEDAQLERVLQWAKKRSKR